MWLLDLQSPQPTSHTKVPKIMLRCRLTTRRIGKTQYREASSLRDLVLCPVSCKYFAEPLRPNCWPEICCDGFLRTWVSWELHLDIIIVWKHQNTHEKKSKSLGVFSNQYAHQKGTTPLTSAISKSHQPGAQGPSKQWHKFSLRLRFQQPILRRMDSLNFWGQGPLEGLNLKHQWLQKFQKDTPIHPTKCS